MAATAAAAGTGGSGSGVAGESSAAMFTRLTAEHSVPKRRLFSLLARVRGAVAWGGGLETRRAAVRRRIMALTALVYCHPSEGERGRGVWGWGRGCVWRVGAGLGVAFFLFFYFFYHHFYFPA